MGIERRIPQKYIMALFAIRDDGYIEDFLGTGAFVGHPPLLVTAEHVVREWSGPYGILITPRQGPRIIPADLLLQRPETDLALLQVPSYPLEQGLELAADDEILHNEPVVCFEYSQTLLQKPDRVLDLQPATRMGNVTRRLDLSWRWGEVGKDMLELSFPALRGACGAPVISNRTFRVWGIIKANVDYHLLPAQTMTVRDDETQIIEETKYMLPLGIAIHVEHLRGILQEIGHLGP